MGPALEKKQFLTITKSVWIIFFIFYGLFQEESKKIFWITSIRSVFMKLWSWGRGFDGKKIVKKEFSILFYGQIENSIKSKPLDEFPCSFFLCSHNELIYQNNTWKEKIFRNIAKILAFYLTRRKYYFLIFFSYNLLFSKYREKKVQRSPNLWLGLN